MLVKAVSAAPVALILGILIGDYLGPSPSHLFLFGVAIFGSLAGILFLSSPRDKSTSWPDAVSFLALSVLLTIVFMGVSVEQRSLNGLENWSLQDAVTKRAEVTLWGSVVDDPHGSRWTTEARVRVDKARLNRSGAQPFDVNRIIAVRAEASAARRLVVLSAGDGVVLRGWLHPLAGYDRYLRWFHVAAVIVATDLVSASRPKSLVYLVANKSRDLVLDGTADLSSKPRALMAGFLLGDTRDIDPEVINEFRSSGLSHLLAVSGSNVAFVLVLVGPLVSRFPRPIRLGAIFLVLIIFGAMTRWEPSVLRACAMAACAVFAAYIGRPARGVRLLGIAVFLLLLADPFLLHSVGFLLSVGASLGICLLAPVIALWLRGPNWFRLAFATTAAAQIGVAPVLLVVFGSIPLVSIPANLLAVPLVGPLTVWGLASGVTSGLINLPAPDLAGALQWPTEVLAEAILGIANLTSQIPIDLSLPAVGVGLVIGGLFALGRSALRALRRRMIRERELVLPSR